MARSLRLSVCPFLLESLQGVGARWHQWLRWHICSYAARCFHVAIIFKMFSFPSSKFTSVTTDRFFKKKKVSLIHILNSLGKITCKRHFRPLFFFSLFESKTIYARSKGTQRNRQEAPLHYFIPQMIEARSQECRLGHPYGWVKNSRMWADPLARTGTWPLQRPGLQGDWLLYPTAQQAVSQAVICTRTALSAHPEGLLLWINTRDKS